MVRASEKVRAKKIMPRACPSFQKAWLDRAKLLKTPGSRAQIRAEPRLDPALATSDVTVRRSLVKIAEMIGLIVVNMIKNMT